MVAAPVTFLINANKGANYTKRRNLRKARIFYYVIILKFIDDFCALNDN